jgi:hypothetical protein
MSAMDVESRDSVSLKPAELDVLAQLLASSGSGVSDTDLDRQVESMPLVVLATEQDELLAFLFGSLERIGGTPSILWSLGATRNLKQAPVQFEALTRELFRRAAISFPDEDVLVGGMFLSPGVYGLLTPLADVVPRPSYTATGEERAWGRRLAKRFGINGEYDDRQFLVPAIGTAGPVVNAKTLKVSPKKLPPVFASLDTAAGDAVIAFGWAMAEYLEGILVASQS